MRPFRVVSRRLSSSPRVLVLMAALLVFPEWLSAATKTTTFTVSLTLQADCSISANALNFGTQACSRPTWIRLQP